MNSDLTLYGFLNAQEASNYFEVTESTIKRWMRTSPPKHILVELSLLDGSHILLRGWRLSGKGLIDRTGYPVSFSEIEQIKWLQSNARTDVIQEKAYRNRIKSLEKLRTAANETIDISSFDSLISLLNQNSPFTP